jgi:hypothetical protein
MTALIARGYGRKQDSVFGIQESAAPPFCEREY